MTANIGSKHCMVTASSQAKAQCPMIGDNEQQDDTTDNHEQLES